MQQRLHIDRACRGSTAFRTSNSSGIARSRKGRCNAAMSTKSREVIYGSQIRGGKIRADGVRERAAEAIREADRAEAEAWSIQMEGYARPAQPSPTIAQCLTLRRADIAPSSKRSCSQGRHQKDVWPLDPRPAGRK
jgi:hypothetical protein